MAPSRKEERPGNRELSSPRGLRSVENMPLPEGEPGGAFVFPILHVEEDWLAVAGKFENTGSAGGSDLLGLYPEALAKQGYFVIRHFPGIDLGARSAG